MNNIKSDIWESMASLGRDRIALNNKIEEIEGKHSKEIDSIFCEFITVLDTFERAEQIIAERNLGENEDANKAIKRLLNAKKKVLFVLEKFGVERIEFPDNMSVDELCVVTDTEPDSSKPTGEIISIDKPGYKRQGHLIRPAEVVIVKN